MRFSKLKSVILASLAIFSFQLYLGIILGYYLPKFFAKKVRSIIFEFKNWRLHFHHWFLGLGILVSTIFYEFLPFSPFSIGLLGGVIFQGIYCYSDWHKILIRKVPLK